MWTSSVELPNCVEPLVNNIEALSNSVWISWTVKVPVIVAPANVGDASVVKSWLSKLVFSIVRVFDAAPNVIVPSWPSPTVRDSFSVKVLDAPTAFIVTLLFWVVRVPAVVKFPPRVTIFPPILTFPCWVCSLPKEPVEVAEPLIFPVVLNVVPVIVPISAALVWILPTEPVDTYEPLTDAKSFIVPVVVTFVADNVAPLNVKSESSLSNPAVL